MSKYGSFCLLPLPEERLIRFTSFCCASICFFKLARSWSEPAFLYSSCNRANSFSAASTLPAIICPAWLPICSNICFSCWVKFTCRLISLLYSASAFSKVSSASFHVSLFSNTVPFRFTPYPSVYVPFLETYALGVASSLFCASITALYFSIASSLVAAALARNIIASTNLELLLTNSSSASFASRTEKPNSLNLSALFCTHFSRSFSDPLRLIHSVCNAR